MFSSKHFIEVRPPKTVDVRPWVPSNVATAETSFQIFVCAQRGFCCTNGHRVSYIRKIRLRRHDYVKKTATCFTTVHPWKLNSRQFGRNGGQAQAAQPENVEHMFPRPHLRQFHWKGNYVSNDLWVILHRWIRLAETLQKLNVFVAHFWLWRTL